MRLSDSIEQFIKEMLTPEETEVELKRNELAEYFRCAPSQINYVLATRFTPDHGYVTESRRGGGGYIRIVRVVQTAESRFQYLINDRIGDAITEVDCMRLIQQLEQSGALDEGEATLMRAAVSSQALSVPVPENVKNTLRARSMKTMLINLARQRSTSDHEGASAQRSTP